MSLYLGIKIIDLLHPRFWLGGLYQALFPPHRWLGSIVHLKFKLIPEADKGIQVVRDWVRNLIYTFDLERASPDKKLTFLGDFLNLATLAYTFDQVAAREYMRRASCVSVSRPTDLLRGKEDQYIVFDLILALDGIDRASIVAGVLFLQ